MRFHRSRSAPENSGPSRGRRILSVAGVFLLVASVTLVASCGHEPNAPRHGQPSPEATGNLPIAGGQIPESISEGDAGSISVWGSSGADGWMLDRVELKVTAYPSDAVAGRIEVTAIGRMIPRGEPGHADPGPGTVPPGEPGSGTAYQGSVELPLLPPGDYVIVLHGPGGDQERMLHMLPGRGWVRFHAYGDSSRPDLGLLVRRDGSVIAFIQHEGPPVRLPMLPESLRVIAGWFREAGFPDLQNRYLSDPPAPGRRIQIALQEGDAVKRVVAEEALMPEPLRVLAGRLEALTRQVHGAPPPPRPRVHGELTVDPLEADPGVARTIRLTLRNDGSAPATLVFRTTQLYDFVLLRMPHMGDGGMGGGMGDGGMGGGMGGGVRGGDPMPPDSIPGDPPLMVWNWAFGRTFPEVETRIELGPGESRVFEETWNGKDNEGIDAGPGMYALMGMVPAELPVPVGGVRLLVRGDIPGPPPLVATLAVEPRIAPPGTARVLTLSVTNLGADSVRVRFRTTQRFDFAVTNPRAMGPGGGGGMPGGGMPGGGMPGMPGIQDGGAPPDSGSVPPPWENPGPIWIWSLGQTFAPEDGVEIWTPGQTRTWTATWNGSDLEGNVVEIGLYAADSWLPGRPFIRTRPVELVVGRP